MTQNCLDDNKRFNVRHAVYWSKACHAHAMLFHEVVASVVVMVDVLFFSRETSYAGALRSTAIEAMFIEAISDGC